jgi:hypothetical protein
MTETKKKPIDDKFRRAFPESTKILEKEETAVKDALFAMRDKQFQTGLVWRGNQCEAVRVLTKNGWSREEILREFRHNGMTASTANKIIDDALC